MQLGSTDAAKRHKGTIIQRAQDAKKNDMEIICVAVSGEKNMCSA